MEDTSNFYLEFSRDRIYNSDKTSRAYRSSINVYSQLLQAIVQSMAPVLMYTAQEAHSYMPNSMFKDGKKPLTVFQQEWFRNTLKVDADFLQQFQLLQIVDELAVLRDKIKDEISAPSVERLLLNKKAALIVE